MSQFLTIRSMITASDQGGSFQDTAASYEAALVSDPANLEATVNLAVLYWCASSRSRPATNALPQELRGQARERLRELLESASERFANCVELRFWERYVAATDTGESFELSECRRLLQERLQKRRCHGGFEPTVE